MFLAGGQDDWSVAPPRPLWLVTRDAIGLVLVAVNAVSWVLLLWAIFGS